jgi:hypothetical protein
MVTARSHKKPIGHAKRTPRPMSSDSDVIVLALVTAQALEAQGDVGEAARWLRRAAWQAKSDGQGRRDMQLARAAAELANGPSPTASLESSSRASERPARHSFLRTTRREGRRREAQGADGQASSSEARAEQQSPERANVWRAMLTLMGAAG